MDDQTLNLLRAAQDEITTLRRQNEIMNAQLDMVDLFRTVLLSSPPRQGEGHMGVDLLYELRKAIAEREESDAAAKPGNINPASYDCRITGNHCYKMPLEDEELTPPRRNCIYCGALNPLYAHVPAPEPDSPVATQNAERRQDRCIGLHPHQWDGRTPNEHCVNCGERRF